MINVQDLKNDYILVDKIASGADGNIFKVRPRIDKYKYNAIKELKIDTKTNDQKETFLNFTRILEKPINSSVLLFYGYSLKSNLSTDLQDHPALIFAYMPTSLDKLLIDQKDFPMSKKYIILLGIAEGMKFIHSHGIMHGNLKPSHILLDNDFYPKISGYGQLKYFNPNIKKSFNGSPIYLAPEITQDEYSFEVDSYSYALLFYQTLTGQIPYQKVDDFSAFISEIQNGKRPDLSNIEHQEIKDFLSKCWSTNSSERMTFSEIIDFLKRKKVREIFGANDEDVKNYLKLHDDKLPDSLDENENEISMMMKSKLIKPFGIINLGNTCFMNSSLQCMLSLTSFIERIDEMISISKEPKILSAFKSFILSRNPSVIKKLVGEMNPVFMGFNQQDSFEFTLSFINSIFNECESVVSELFIGESNNIIKCAKCNSECLIDQSFSSISLSVESSRRILYVPYDMKSSLLKMSHVPKVTQTVDVIENCSDKITIKNFVLMAKTSKFFDVINEIKNGYSQLFAFEIPDSKIDNGFAYTVVKIKNQDGISITEPFLCEIPTQKEISEEELRVIIFERLNGSISSQYKNCIEKVKESIQFSKPSQFPFRFKCNEKTPNHSIDYVNVKLNLSDVFDFSNRKLFGQKSELSLENLFNSHIQPSQLMEGCKFTDDSCGKRSRCFQRIKYKKLPKILIFQVKRSSERMMTKPDESLVSFPNLISIGLDGEYNSFKVDPDESDVNRYELKAISKHDGTFSSGHYWADVKRGERWFSISDSVVFPLPEELNNATGTAYVVFYQQV